MYLKLAVVLALSASISACTPGSAPGLGDLVSVSGTDNSTKLASSANNENDDNFRIRRVMELRQRYRGSTDSAGLEELGRAENDAANHFLTTGEVLAREGRYQEAIEKYEMGLLA